MVLKGAELAERRCSHGEDRELDGEEVQVSEVRRHSV